MKKITGEQIAEALCDVLDGVYNPYEVQSNTGLEIERCEEILKIRDGVKKEWMK